MPPLAATRREEVFFDDGEREKNDSGFRPATSQYSHLLCSDQSMARMPQNRLIFEEVVCGKHHVDLPAIFRQRALDLFLDGWDGCSVRPKDRTKEQGQRNCRKADKHKSRGPKDRNGRPSLSNIHQLIYEKSIPTYA